MSDSENRISKAADKARTSANAAMEKTRGKAKDAARKTGDGIEHNPLSVLIGGAAVGMIAGVLMPRTEKETEVLGPIGKRVVDGATAAALAARDAGREELEALAPDSNTARSKAGDILSHVAKAASDAGKSAAKK